MAWESLRNASFRVKKYLKLTSFSSSTMAELAVCSNGSLMFKPKDISRPAPSFPAFMMPGPAPVRVMKPRAAISRQNSRACR